MTITVLNPNQIKESKFILIPFTDGTKKKIVKSIQSLDKISDAWRQEALNLLNFKTIDEGKFIIQWVAESRIILLHLNESWSLHKIANTVRTLLFKQFDPKKESEHVVVYITDAFKNKTYASISNGAELANVSIDYYKTDKKISKGSITYYIDQKKNEIHTLLMQGRSIANTQEHIMHLVNTPSNIKNPQYIVDWAKERFFERNIRINVMNKEELEEQGFHALLNVGKGSKTPPYLLTLEYKPKSKQKLKHIGLVGKGVTFDTGGISLKDPLNMHLMKSDMGGAAAVLGAIDLVEKLKLEVHITAVIPLAENAIGPDAYRPGDVISSFSGKSIEVIDTDAEGRLILADALTYIVKTYHPDHLIDLATLTGSCIMTLGYKAAALYCNDDKLADSVIKSGESSGERVWRMPLWDEYADEMNSDIADIKNLATKPVAGATTAAKFLQAFIADHKSWVHLDIAGVAMTDNDFSKQRSATAYGVFLLKQLIETVVK